MDSTDQQELAHRSLVSDLKASVLARRELDPELEDEVLEAFLTRLEARVDARVSQQLARIEKRSPKKSKSDSPQVEIIASAFALAIPLMVVAAIWAGTLGVISVMGGLVAVILLYFIDRWATD